MTALPESDAATSLVLNALFSKTRRIASATAAPSMMAPSTMLSGGTGSMAKAATLKPLPAGLQLDGLDGARADVETDDRLSICQNQTRVYVLTEPAGCRVTTGHAGAKPVPELDRVRRRRIPSVSRSNLRSACAGPPASRDNDCVIDLQNRAVPQRVATPNPPSRHDVSWCESCLSARGQPCHHNDGARP